MKKIILKRTIICGLFTLFFSSSLFAQIPNASFENWTDCIPDDWSTANACGVLVTITKSSNAAAGNFSAKGEVINLFGQTIGPIIQSGADGEGFAIAERYTAVEGMYIFQPVGGDRFGVNVAFSKSGNVIAQGAIALTSAAPAFSKFSVPMTYTTPDVPDNAIIQILIAGPVTGSDYHVGSVMYVDALAFNSGSSAPSLSITRNGNTVIISWPSSATGYSLQSTSTLASPNWTTVTTSGNEYQFTPTTQAFFRLIKP